MEDVLNVFKDRKIFITMIVLTVFSALIGGTYAYLQFQASNRSITGSSCFSINYTKGQDIDEELYPGETYDTGHSTDVVMYSKSTCKSNVVGKLYITTNDDSTMDLSDKALKYAVTVNGTIMAEGTVNGTKNQVIYSNFILNKEATTYKVYVWLDQTLEDTSNLATESYSGFIHAEAIATSDINQSYAYDLSGNGYDEMIYGATYTSEGLAFDGTDDYVSLPSDLPLTFPMSYSVKFKTSSTANQIIFGDYKTKTALGLYTNNTKLILCLNTSNISVYNTGGLTTGTFYTIDLVYNSMKDIKVYLDGVELTKDSTVNSWNWEGTDSYIGKRIYTGSSSTLFNGVIEKFIIYDDALTATEISSNLAVTSGEVCGDGIVCDNLVLYYNFKAIKDLSGNNKNAVYFGTPSLSGGYTFDGTDDYVLLPSDLGVTLPATYSITFKTNNNSNQIMFGDYNTNASLGLYSNNTSLITSTCAPGSTSMFTLGSLTLDTFYTIDVVYNSITDAKAYLNGVELSKSGKNCWTWSDTNSYLGKRSSGTYFNGSIKRFIVYDDALTQSEVQHNYGVTNKQVCGDGIICDNLKLYYYSN